MFAAACERWLDHYDHGAGQYDRLKSTVIRRCGSGREPRADQGDAGDLYLTDAGHAVIREETELLPLGYIQALARELGVLYATDGLERVYTSPAGQEDTVARQWLRWYQHPARGGLTATLHLLDRWLTGLRTVALLLNWEDDLSEITYQALPPHWVWWWECPRQPGEERLAYAVAYSEPEARDERGNLLPESAWTAYVRPALPSDPWDAPTRGPYERTGRLVRYRRAGVPYASPWPLPEVDSLEVLADQDQPDGRADGPNPLVQMGGWSQGRRIWSPLVLYAAEPLTTATGLRLPVAEAQCQLAEELDFGVTAALHTANLQSFGQPVYRGAGDPPRELGPQTVVHVQDAAGDFYYRSPDGEPEAHLRAIHLITALGAVLESLPPDTFSYQPPSIETGPAKKLRRSALIQLRASRTIQAERPEQRRFEIERLLHNAHTGRTRRPLIPWDTELTVRWGELAQPVDWAGRLQEMETELRLGLTELVDLVGERHGLDRTEAERRLAARAEAGHLTATRAAEAGQLPQRTATEIIEHRETTPEEQ